jgi:hypothetical protein
MDSKSPAINLKQTKLLSFYEFYQNIFDQYHEDFIIDSNCLLGQRLIKKAVRFENCLHFECYDEESVKEHFKVKQNFPCFKCGNVISWGLVKYDGFFTAILNFNSMNNKKIIFRKGTKNFEFVEENNNNLSSTFSDHNEILGSYLSDASSHNFVVIPNLDKNNFNINLFYNCEKINLFEKNIFLVINFSNSKNFYSEWKILYGNSNILIFEIFSVFMKYQSLDDFKKILILSELIFYIDNIKNRLSNIFNIKILFIINEDLLRTYFSFLFKEQNFTHDNFIQLFKGREQNSNNNEIIIVKESEEKFCIEKYEHENADVIQSVEVVKFIKEVFSEKNIFDFSVSSSESGHLNSISLFSKESILKENYLKFYIIDHQDIYENILNPNQECYSILIDKLDFPRIFLNSKISEFGLLNQFVKYFSNRNLIFTNSYDLNPIISLQIMNTNIFEKFCLNFHNKTSKNKFLFIFLDQDIKLDIFLLNAEKLFIEVDQEDLNLYEDSELFDICIHETHEKKIFKCVDERQNKYYFFLESENKSAILIHNFYQFIYNEMRQYLKLKLYKFHEQIEIFSENSNQLIKNTYKIRKFIS